MPTKGLPPCRAQGAADLADAPQLAERLWGARHEIRVRGQVIAAERRAESDAWWERVVGVVSNT